MQTVMARINLYPPPALPTMPRASSVLAGGDKGKLRAARHEQRLLQAAQPALQRGRASTALTELGGVTVGAGRLGACSV
jgi:hypothetical protein